MSGLPFITVPHLKASVWDHMNDANNVVYYGPNNELVRWKVPNYADECYLGLIFGEHPAVMLIKDDPGNIHETPDPGGEPPPPNRYFMTKVDYLKIAGGALDLGTEQIANGGNLYKIILFGLCSSGDRARVLKV